MERLFQFLYRYRALILFLFLEYLAFVLTKNRTVYQQTEILKISKEITGSVNQFSANIFGYVSLKKSNEELREENARLRNLLSNPNTGQGIGLPGDRPPSVLQQYYFVPAEVINNTTNRFNNFITINKGAIHGIEQNMAVIGTKGIIGKVESVSTNFSTVISVLHTGYYVSCRIDPGGIQGTLKWDADQTNSSTLFYVPRHLKMNLGDTVKTSGYNAIFPTDIPLGVISEIKLTDDASFYDLKVLLFANFNSLKNVYVIGNRLGDERLELEQPLRD